MLRLGPAAMAFMEEGIAAVTVVTFAEGLVAFVGTRLRVVEEVLVRMLRLCDRR